MLYSFNDLFRIFTKDSNDNDSMSGLFEIAPTRGTLSTRDITIDTAADLFIDPAAPTAARLITIDTVPSGTREVRISWISQGIPYIQSATSDIHVAAFVVVTVNAGDDATALARLTLANNGVGTHSADTRKRMLDAGKGEISYNTRKDAVDITRIDIGAIPPTDTGTIPVYLSVEFLT